MSHNALSHELASAPAPPASSALTPVHARSLALHWTMTMVLLGSLCMHWISAGDHALYSPDEGRYASAAQSMADGGGWLVPHVGGEAHLTKPPLVYWMQALALRAIGHNELAMRLPSLIATSVLALLVYVAGVRMRSRRLGVLAAGVLACMPLHMVVGRMAIIDPTLATCWFGALLLGWSAIERGRSSDVALLWLCIALGLLAKGPIALLPLAVIVAWLALAGRVRELKTLRPMAGLVLAATPVVIWAVLVMRAHPQAMSIWLGQTAGRLIGEAGASAHAKPWWYYAPVFAAGLFPASMLLALPGLNMRWRAAWRTMCRGDALAFWIIATALPLTFFTLMSGKLMTYLLTLSGPMALLGANALDRWLAGAWDQTSGEFSPPRFALPLTVAVIGIAIAGIAGVLWLDRVMIAWTLPFIGLFAASAWFMCGRRNDAIDRWNRLVVLWVAGMIAWVGVFEIEDAVRRRDHPLQVVHRAQELVGTASLRIGVLGFRDPTLEFYARRPIAQINSALELEELLAQDRHRVVLLADDADWRAFSLQHPECAAQFRFVDRAPRWFGKSTSLLLPVQEVPSATQSEAFSASPVARTPAE